MRGAWGDELIIKTNMRALASVAVNFWFQLILQFKLSLVSFF